MAKSYSILMQKPGEDACIVSVTEPGPNASQVYAEIVSPHTGPSKGVVSYGDLYGRFDTVEEASTVANLAYVTFHSYDGEIGAFETHLRSVRKKQKDAWFKALPPSLGAK